MKIIYRLLRWNMIQKMNRSNFSTEEINIVMKAFGLRKAGLPTMENMPPPPKGKGPKDTSKDDLDYDFKT